MSLDFFKSMNISASGLTAQRARIDVIASNIANAESTRSPEGGPYRRKTVVFSEMLENIMNPSQAGLENLSGVRIDSIEGDQRPFRMEYDPSHADADEEGYVKYPNVYVLREMVDLIDAQRAYEANVSAMNITKSFADAALRIGRS